MKDANLQVKQKELKDELGKRIRTPAEIIVTLEGNSEAELKSKIEELYSKQRLDLQSALIKQFSDLKDRDRIEKVLNEVISQNAYESLIPHLLEELLGLEVDNPLVDLFIFDCETVIPPSELFKYINLKLATLMKKKTKTA